MTTLITGGAGYIGSHTILQLLKSGHTDLVVIDNLSNSSEVALHRVAALADKPVRFIQGDIRDAAFIDQVFASGIKQVIHFAGLKAVGESTTMPIEYYDNNVNGTLVLLSAMKKYGVNKLIFSSSATVYGDPEQLPITELAPTGGTTNPYGRSKLHIEQILQDVCAANPDFTAIALRYFNPVGADKSGMIGEDPSGKPNNLMPYVTQVAVGKLASLTVFGDDYDTADGTGVRDYIHVLDLADGHVAAIENIDKLAKGFHPINLGTGVGYSVLDIIRSFQSTNEVELAYSIGPRRPGDIAACYASAEKALELLGWETKYTLEDMCQDAWQWQQLNPNGYQN